MDTGGEVRQPGTRQGGKEKRSSPPKANIPLEKRNSKQRTKRAPKLIILLIDLQNESQTDDVHVAWPHDFLLSIE